MSKPQSMTAMVGSFLRQRAIATTRNHSSFTRGGHLNTALRVTNNNRSRACLRPHQSRSATHIAFPNHYTSRSLSSSTDSPSSTPDSSSSSSSSLSSSEVDTLIEDLSELYATAQDEFEIAVEETEKKTVYAEADRQAAHEAFDALKTAYRAALEGDEARASEVKRRVGQRMRELEQGFERLDEMVKEGD